MTMTRDEAIEWYRRITRGSGLDRYSVLDVLRRGKIAEDLWEDSTFAYGMEYGALLALIEVFDLTKEEIG